MAIRLGLSLHRVPAVKHLPLDGLERHIRRMGFKGIALVVRRLSAVVDPGIPDIFLCAVDLGIVGCVK